MPKRRDKFSPRLSREHSPYLFFLRYFKQRCPVEIFHVSGDKKRKRTLNLNQYVFRNRTLGEIRYKGNKKMSDLSRKMLVFNKIELLFRHNNGCQQEILQLDSIEGCSLIRTFLWTTTQRCLSAL